MGAVCTLRRCGKRRRVYAAVSKHLNERASDPCRRWGLRPYVFKVGSTKICVDRWSSLREDRKPYFKDGIEYFDEPSYAGVADWKILSCWQVDAARHDDEEFKPWLTRTFPSGEVAHVKVYRPIGLPGIEPGTCFKDLFIMSEDHVRSMCPGMPNDPTNEQLLAVAAEAVVALIEAYRTDTAA